MMKAYKKGVLGVALLTAMGSAGVSAVTFVMDTTGDTYTIGNTSAAQTNNYGHREWISVTEAGDNRARGLVAFNNLPSLSGIEVAKAVVRMELKQTWGSRIEVRPLTQRWVEGNGTPGSGATYFTYNGWDDWIVQGALNDTLIPAIDEIKLPFVGADASGTFVEFDVTPTVRDWLDGNLNNEGFLFYETSNAAGAGNLFHSRESTVPGVTPPQLIIDVVPELTSVELEDTAVLEFLSSVGQPYQLEYTTDLASSSAWHTEWHDDFDTYTPGAALPSPWIDGSYAPLVVTDYSTVAYYFSNYNDHRWGASFRPLEPGAGTVYARVRVNPAGGAELALTADTESYAYGISYNDDNVRFHLDDYQGTRDNYSVKIKVNGEYEVTNTVNFDFVNYSWYDIRLSWTADRQTFTFEYKRDIEAEYTLGLQHTTSEPLTLNYVGLSTAVHSSGNGAQWVGYSLVPNKPSFTDMQFQDTAAMEFPSLSGQLYLLEYTTDNASTWHSAGASLTGTGGNMYFYDPQEPTGSSTSKAYRIVTP